MFIDSVLEYAKDHQKVLEVGGALVGAIATAGGSLAASTARDIAKRSTDAIFEHYSKQVKAQTGGLVLRPSERGSTTEIERYSPVIEVEGTRAPERYTAAQTARERVNEKLNVLETSRQIQVNRGKRASRASNILIFGQYVLGGILTASAFITQHVDPTAVGCMGIVVIAATAARKHYQPEVDAEEAERKAVRYRDVIEETRDDLLEIDEDTESGQDRTKEVRALNRRVTNRIREIENSDPPRGRKSHIKPNRKSLPN